MWMEYVLILLPFCQSQSTSWLTGVVFYKFNLLSGNVFGRSTYFKHFPHSRDFFRAVFGGISNNQLLRNRYWLSLLTPLKGMCYEWSGADTPLPPCLVVQ
ncbi:uncharacterized protein LOC141864054 isoform X2 [Acropora palmata]|uniref:uncharacterized protein LOC141864054 isoform X2 n=1 Tax=Acropora palmata TaxID=6131 RepID=UPI003DA022DF